jgi:hypothetical protein
MSGIAAWLDRWYLRKHEPPVTSSFAPQPSHVRAISPDAVVHPAPLHKPTSTYPCCSCCTFGGQLLICPIDHDSPCDKATCGQTWKGALQPEQARV